MDNIFVTIDTIHGNQIYKRNASVSRDNYSEEDWNALLNGEEVESEWDDNGNPITWDVLSDDDEEV